MWNCDGNVPKCYPLSYLNILKFNEKSEPIFDRIRVGENAGSKHSNFPKVRTPRVLGTVQTCSDQSDYIAGGERSRTEKNSRKLHSDGPHRFLGRLLAFSVFVAQGKQSATLHALYSNTRSSLPKARSTPGVHSQTEICDEKYWKVWSVLDSDVTGCRVSIVSSSQNSWAKAPHQSAETTGRAAETDNFLQSAGKELRLTPCPDAEVTLQSSNMAMGDPRRKLSFGWLETSSVSILTWVIFQPWSRWHQTVNMKLLDILLYSTMIL